MNSAAAPLTNVRIGLFHPYPHRLGGSQQVTLMLARELPNLGFEPVVICPEEGEFTEAAHRQGTTVLICQPGARWLSYGKSAEGVARWLSPLHLLQLIAYWFRLRRDLRQSRIALLHCNDLRAVVMGAMAARLAGIPALWHMHVAPGRGAKRYLDGALSLITKTKVFVSHAMRANWTLPHWILGPHCIIPNGIANTAIVAALPRANRPLILSVGALSAIKGQDVLVRALPTVRQELPNMLLQIAGKDWTGGGYERSLRTIAQQSNLDSTVEFLGQRQDAAALMATADLVVIPSRSESFGLVALEAMAQGKPVIASDTGGLKDIVIDGQTGLLVRPNDPTALADAILRILRDSDLAKRMGDQGRRRVQEHFSSLRMTERFAQLYRSILAKA